MACTRHNRPSNACYLLASTYRRLPRNRGRAAGKHTHDRYDKQEGALIMDCIRFLLTVLVGLTLVGAMLPVPARADGLLFSNGVSRQPLESHINVTIKDKIATTSLEQTFQSTVDKQVSAVYIAPVPQGATVT